jgi:hypothetical protein
MLYNIREQFSAIVSTGELFQSNSSSGLLSTKLQDNTGLGNETGRK